MTVLVVACMHAVGTSKELDGSFACGPMTCASGELCVDSGICGSNTVEPADTYACATPPTDCPLSMCYDDQLGSGSDNCPACIVDLCQSGGNVISYDGERTVSCEDVLF